MFPILISGGVISAHKNICIACGANADMYNVLGGDFTCIKCSIGYYDGYAPNYNKGGPWQPSIKTKPCTHCGFQAPAHITKRQFRAAIRKRNNDPVFIKQMDEYISKIIEKKKLALNQQ